MAFERAKIKEVLEKVYLIDDAGDSTCYLVCGRDKAVLVDTANGYEDLRVIVRTLTDLPVMVVNTHGHGDHIFGNVYFDEAYIHPEDLALAEYFFGCAKEDLDKHGLKPCPLKPIEVGDRIDLGDRELEVVSLRGHTAGSIGLLDRTQRALYTGDGLNFHLWMQLDHSLSIREVQKTFLHVKEKYAKDFDWILTGHAKDLRGADVLDLLLNACDEILAGRTENDPPYEFFGGTCSQHPLNDVPGEVIVYWKDRV